MLIPLGFLAASGAGGASFDLLQTSLITSSTASVTFSNLNNYASSYQHLQIRYTAFNSTAYWFALTFNGDTTAANYRSHRLTGNGSNVQSGTSTGETDGMTVFALSGSSTIPGSGVIDILDPFETTKNKTLRAFSGFSNNVALTSGLWMSTSSATSIEFRTQGGYNMQNGSRISLYGLKAA
jgi:hypothetical protein